jgi:hypothetical protein
MARILFFISSILFISSISAAASSKTVNLRYAGSPMIELGISKLGLGLGSNSLSTTLTSSDGVYSLTGSSATAKLTLYSSGLGTDSWYAAGTGSAMKIKVNRLLSSDSATTTATYTSFTVGYHWFWNVFNLNLGFGSGSLAINKIDINDSSNNTVSTVDGTKLNLPAMDLGFGLAF